MKIITNKMLKGACPSQRRLFRKVFPDGAPVTLAAARKAEKAGLAVTWAAYLLPVPLYYEFLAKYKQPSICDKYRAKNIRLLISMLQKAKEEK